MTLRMRGKRVLVTAAGQGIGRAIAIACLQEGAAVYATDINVDTLEELKTTHPGLETALLDVRDTAAIADISARIGTVDAIVHCAGYVHHGTILECEEQDWAFTMELNVTSAYRIIRSFLPGMLAAGGGSIVSISSVASSVKGVPNRFAYGASKAALIGLTKAIAADFVEKGIRCNAICPGTVDSPSLQARMAAQGDYEATRAAFMARQPMRRLGTPEEIAALAVYLASDESSYTTGAIHVIDGGWCT
ncbi:MAG: SDR family oxidoreductase [Pirellulaceae bacterium]|nr:SDR family oxidoreductase [Planctomycetales bacterium]